MNDEYKVIHFQPVMYRIMIDIGHVKSWAEAMDFSKKQITKKVRRKVTKELAKALINSGAIQCMRPMVSSLTDEIEFRFYVSSFGKKPGFPEDFDE